MSRILFLHLLFLCPVLSSQILFSEDFSSKRIDENMLTGPLRISADHTFSKERGKKVEAQGNVKVRYEMDTGDVLEFFSQFFNYDDAVGEGMLWGVPKVIWTPFVSPSQKTVLTSDKIILKIRDSQLAARGKVTVVQGSSTLTAEQAEFFNQEKKLLAYGQRPTFVNQGQKQLVQISSEEILSFIEQKKVQFHKKVQGKIDFSSD